MVRTADSCFVTFFSPAFTGRQGTDQNLGLTSPKMLAKFRNLGMKLGQRYRYIPKLQHFSKTFKYILMKYHPIKSRFFT